MASTDPELILTGSRGDINALLHMEALPSGQYRATRLDPNRNDRVFGGQLLGLAIVAAAAKDAGRTPSMLQATFLQGAVADAPIDYATIPLQQGKRFSTWQVTARQGPRNILTAIVTLQVALSSLEHQAAMPADIPAPESLRNINMLDLEIKKDAPAGAYTLQNKPLFDLCFIDPDSFLLQPGPSPHLCYWAKVAHAVPRDPIQQAAALAYLSDYWFAYTSLISHKAIVGARQDLYVASLNHSLWLYASFDVNDWLLFDCDSPRAANGRGLCTSRIFDRDGRLIACAAQECLITQAAS